eukprot:NODE_649_length_5036_cov_1.140571.p4 type:complete len:238 gc:universal NODE_649_length_5036_cov_1.140571:3693-4406(+)
MENLLSQFARAQQGQSPVSSHLVEFNAGKMKVEGKKLVADKRKGVLYLDKKDGILQFCWKVRQSQEPEDEFMVFGDAKWVCVDEKQFIYCLKFDGGNTSFYWVQEYNHEEKLKKIYDLVNGDVLKSAEGVVKSKDGTSGKSDIKLSDEFTHDSLKPLLSNKGVVDSLFPLLPADHILEEVLQSVQFKQSLSSLDHLIRNGHLKDVLQQLGVQYSGDEKGSQAVELFLKAIKDKYCKK